MRGDAASSVLSLSVTVLRPSSVNEALTALFLVLEGIQYSVSMKCVSQYPYDVPGIIYGTSITVLTVVPPYYVQVRTGIRVYGTSVRVEPTELPYILVPYLID